MITNVRCDWCQADMPGERGAAALSIFPPDSFSKRFDLCETCTDLVQKLGDRVKQEAFERRMNEVRRVCRQVEENNAPEPAP